MREALNKDAGALPAGSTPVGSDGDGDIKAGTKSATITLVDLAGKGREGRGVVTFVDRR